MIKCMNLIKKYNNKNVLNGIDLDIKEGEIYGLLGPSGAGKTTLIKILTGQIKYDGGDVVVFNKKTSELTGLDKKQFGIMMDQFGIYDRLSCVDNLRIYADIYNISHSKIDGILDWVGLKDSAKKSATNLSKGMEARLRLARVFLHSPKIIFLDEPTSGLDPLTMKAIHKLILEKKNEGCTIFLTTHNMEEAYNLCDRVALLNEGRIVEEGKPKDLCMKYNHKKSLDIELVTGEKISLMHDSNAKEKIYELLSDNKIESIHSSEPNLEAVFLELTGRKLEGVQ